MNKNSMYDLGTYIAEIYDQEENHNDDVLLIKDLMGGRKNLKILEPFCGTGRISLELAKDNFVTGIDNAKGMLDLFKEKIDNTTSQLNEIVLRNEDILTCDWEKDFDMLVLGCNCFYELPTLETQELCIQKAYDSLKPGGFLYIDGNHMEGDLDENWQDNGEIISSLGGICKDGSKVESTRRTVWFDVKKRLAQFERYAKVTMSNGEVLENSYIQQKHPISKYEIENAALSCGFEIINTFGSRSKEAYSDDSSLAIFWLKKPNI